MKIVDPGLRYELATGNSLVFLQKEGGKVIRAGTTNEELLEVLIDRVTEAYQKLPCEESIRALYLLREALATFRLRSANRVNAKVEGTHQPHFHVFEAVAVSRSRSVATEIGKVDNGPNRIGRARRKSRYRE